jgi:hypothetical protein
MVEVSGVSSVPEPTVTQETPQTDTSATGTVSTTLPANATIGQLAATYKPVLDAIMMAIANNVCTASNRSNQRLHDILAEAEQAAKK